MLSNPSDCISLPFKARGLKRARDETMGGDDGDDARVMEPKTKKTKAKRPASTPKTPTSSSAHGKDMFKGYPLQDLPQPGDNKGAHSYTLKASNGAAP